MRQLDAQERPGTPGRVLDARRCMRQCRAARSLHGDGKLGGILVPADDDRDGRFAADVETDRLAFLLAGFQPARRIEQRTAREDVAEGEGEEFLQIKPVAGAHVDTAMGL